MSRTFIWILISLALHALLAWGWLSYVPEKAAGGGSITVNLTAGAADTAPAASPADAQQPTDVAQSQDISAPSEPAVTAAAETPAAPVPEPAVQAVDNIPAEVATRVTDTPEPVAQPAKPEARKPQVTEHTAAPAEPPAEQPQKTKPEAVAEAAPAPVEKNTAEPLPVKKPAAVAAAKPPVKSADPVVQAAEPVKPAPQSTEPPVEQLVERPVTPLAEALSAAETGSSQAEQESATEDAQQAGAAAQPAAGDFLQARILSDQKPKYPRRAIARDQQGQVKLRLFLNARGEVERYEVIASSGFKLLDRAVQQFVQQERFVPAMRNGLAVASTQTFSFTFRLQ